MKNILRKFIYFVLILSLAIPLSTVFEAITFNEVYAQKKERKKPPKARRTQTLSKKVGTDFLKAQEALAEEKPDESLKILDRLWLDPIDPGLVFLSILRFWVEKGKKFSLTYVLRNGF